MNNLRLAFVIDAVDNSASAFAGVEKRVTKTAEIVKERLGRIGEINEGVVRGIGQTGIGVGIGLEFGEIVEDSEKLEHLGAIAGTTGEEVSKFGDEIFDAAGKAKISANELLSAWVNGAAGAGGSLDGFRKNLQNVATEIQILGGSGDAVGAFYGTLETHGIQAADEVGQAFATMRAQVQGSHLELAQVSRAMSGFLGQYQTIGHEGVKAVSEIGAVVSTVGAVSRRPQEALGNVQQLLNLMNTPQADWHFRAMTNVEVQAQPESLSKETRPLPDILRDLAKNEVEPGMAERYSQFFGDRLYAGLSQVFRDIRERGPNSDLEHRLAMRGDPEKDRETAADLGNGPEGTLQAMRASVHKVGVDALSASKPLWDFLGANSKLVAVAATTTAVITAIGWAGKLAAAGFLAFGKGIGGTFKFLGLATSLVADLSMWTGVRLVASFPKAGEAAFAFGEALSGGVGKGVMFLVRAALPMLGAALTAAGEGIAAFGALIMATPIGWILAGIAAVAGAAYLIYRNWAPIKKWWHDLWEAAGDDWDRFRGKVTTPIDPHSSLGRVRDVGKRGGPGNEIVGEAVNFFTKPGTLEQQRRQGEAFDFFKKKGWSDEQAAGIVYNIKAESSFNEKAIGDGGNAHGLVQWHSDRAKAIAEHFGKRVDQMGFEEQLGAIDWELRNPEKPAGDKLAGAKTAAEAGSIVSRSYERPAHADSEAAARGMGAESVLRQIAAAGGAKQRQSVALTVSGLPAGAKVTATSDDGDVDLGLGHHMAAAQ